MQTNLHKPGVPGCPFAHEVKYILVQLEQIADEDQYHAHLGVELFINVSGKSVLMTVKGVSIQNPNLVIMAVGSSLEQLETNWRKELSTYQAKLYNKNVIETIFPAKTEK